MKIWLVLIITDSNNSLNNSSGLLVLESYKDSNTE